MQRLIDSLEPHERRAIALVGLMIRMHGGKDGEGAFTGASRYGVLTVNLRLAAEQSRTVRQFWDRAARRLRWTIGIQYYDDAVLELLAPDPGDGETLRALADRTQSIVMIARSRARHAREKARATAPLDESRPFDDPLDVFDMIPEDAAADGTDGAGAAETIADTGED